MRTNPSDLNQDGSPIHNVVFQYNTALRAIYEVRQSVQNFHIIKESGRIVDLLGNPISNAYPTDPHYHQREQPFGPTSVSHERAEQNTSICEAEMKYVSHVVNWPFLASQRLLRLQQQRLETIKQALIERLDKFPANGGGLENPDPKRIATIPTLPIWSLKKGNTLLLLQKTST